MSNDELKNKNIEELVRLARECEERLQHARKNPKQWNTIESIRDEIKLIYDYIDDRINVVFIRGGTDV